MCFWSQFDEMFVVFFMNVRRKDVIQSELFGSVGIKVEKMLHFMLKVLMKQK